MKAWKFTNPWILLVMLAMGWNLPTYLSARDWHVHEMIFGYVAAVLAGFLLTAIPNWTGRLPVAGRPLVLLDPSRLYARYVGESETRLRNALTTVDAMAPAVMWIDEMEKGFSSGGEGDGGVSRRILGTFLRWLQDRPDGVFVVATANDVSSLPPEFLRKGRFDEVFFVDLPGPAARRQIFTAHLKSRRQDPDAFDLEKLTEISESFSGAEIEAVVVGALYRAFAAERRPGTRETGEGAWTAF